MPHHRGTLSTSGRGHPRDLTSVPTASQLSQGTRLRLVLTSQHHGTVPAPDPVVVELLRERVRQAEAQRNALQAAIEDMRMARSLTVADDEHDPEGSMVSLDQARDLALLDRTERTLAELASAQERLAAGSYGSCERCGRPIPVDRLRARPEARLCVPCSSGTTGARRSRQRR